MTVPSKYQPARIAAVDIPATVFGGTDNALEVASIMSAHDYGHFQQSAVFWDQMMADDRCLAIMSRRAAGLGNLPLVFKPSPSVRAKSKAQMVAEVLGGKDGEGGKFADYVTGATQRAILSWGIAGFPVAVQKIFETKDDPWSVRLKVWHPQFCRWDYQQQRFMIITSNRGQIALPRENEEDREWFVYAPYGQQYGWRRGVVRALCFRFLQRRWNDRDWSRYDEVHGIPARLAKYPAGSSASPETERFIQDVGNIGNEPALAIPQGDADKAGYGFELVEATAKTYETFRDHRAEINQDMAILVLGENDTTGGAADNGAAGSFASKQVSVTISQDKAKEDAALGQCLRQGVFRQWAALNYDDPELAPIICWETEPPEDDAARAGVMKAVGDAITSLKAAVGNRLDEDAILERFDIPVTQDQAAYEVEHPPVDPNDPNAQGGPGGADGDGADPEDAKDTAKDKADTAKLSAADLAIFALKSMATDGEGRKLLYPEEVAAKGAVLAGKALTQYRAALVEAIRGAKDEADAKVRIAKALKMERDPAGLARIVQQVRLMGNMGGRYTAAEQT